MTKEEIKQYLRNQIDFSIKIQDNYNMDIFYLYYNKSYLRALKLSKIIGSPVNKENFNGGEMLFRFNSNYKTFLFFEFITNYLNINYSNGYYEQCKILEEVFNEYEEYKGYIVR